MKNYVVIIVTVLSFVLFGASVPFDPFRYSITPPVTEPPFNFTLAAVETPQTRLPRMREIPIEYKAVIDKAIRGMGIPIEIIAAILQRESHFSPEAQSPIRENGHRDMGICQFNSQYIDWYSERYNGGVIFDPMNPEEAIPIMAQHIKWLYERYGHWPDVIMAYNAGFARIDSGDIPDSAWDYLFKVYE